MRGWPQNNDRESDADGRGASDPAAFVSDCSLVYAAIPNSAELPSSGASRHLLPMLRTGRRTVRRFLRVCTFSEAIAAQSFAPRSGEKVGEARMRGWPQNRDRESQADGRCASDPVAFADCSLVYVAIPILRNSPHPALRATFSPCCARGEGLCRDFCAFERFSKGSRHSPSPRAAGRRWAKPG